MRPDPALAAAPWLRAPESRRILDLLEADGREARFVGGCVRDTLLDPSVDEVDLDVATQLPPPDVLDRLRRAGVPVVPTGLAHGTVTARLGRRTYEVTTLRHDVETDGRRAKVVFTDDFEADAARRDFTFNALSCDRAGQLFDYFGGRADLLAGRVRFVGDPVARIREDYLRILRFFRFHARFGRGDADPAALAACHAERGGMARLARERIRAELLRMLVAPGAAASLGLMVRTSVWSAVLEAEPDLDRFVRFVRHLPRATAVARLAALVRGRMPADEVSRALRLSARERADLARLCDEPLPPADLDGRAVRRLVYRHGGTLAASLLALAWAERGDPPETLAPALDLALSWSRPTFPLGGADLLARGIASGPALGARLEAVRAWWVEHDFAPDRDACLAELDRRLAAGRP